MPYMLPKDSSLRVCEKTAIPNQQAKVTSNTQCHKHTNTQTKNKQTKKTQTQKSGLFFFAICAFVFRENVCKRKKNKTQKQITQ